jgi:hypothetical protein
MYRLYIVHVVNNIILILVKIIIIFLIHNLLYVSNSSTMIYVIFLRPISVLDVIIDISSSTSRMIILTLDL